MVHVSVSEGLLEGEVVQNEYGGTYCSFKGIPYAQPPLGDLRFKAPQAKQPWTGTREAKQFGPVSYQFNFMNPELQNMSEDCLYLNVYTPDIKPPKPLPVMVWIHGGAFTWGSGDDDMYGPQFLVRNGVILVTFNYRLDALGFLCLNTADIPGNAGMKDQVAALRWVKKNIGNFGGDPDNVTIFGESAGGASVSYQLVSTMSKGLFKRAIAQSGAATCRWAQDLEPRDSALLLAKQLGCFSEDDKELYEFFKKLPAKMLINSKLPKCKSKSNVINFTIVNEKDFGKERFYYGDITEVFRNSIHEGVEIMTGYTRDEGLMAVAVDPSLEEKVADANSNHDFFVPELIKAHYHIAEKLEVGKKTREYYLEDGVISQDSVLKFFSTDMFVYGCMLATKLYSMKNKVYCYKFNCFSERNFLGHCFGLTELIQDKSVVCHADDLAYLFPIKFIERKVDGKSETFKLINRVTKLWTNFAKYGNPTPDKSLGVEWKPYTLREQEYLDLGNELRIGTAPDKEELQFWDSIFMKYLPEYTI